MLQNYGRSGSAQNYLGGNLKRKTQTRAESKEDVKLSSLPFNVNYFISCVFSPSSFQNKTVSFGQVTEMRASTTPIMFVDN